MQRRHWFLLLAISLTACGTSGSAPRADIAGAPATRQSAVVPETTATSTTTAGVDPADVLSTVTISAADGRVWVRGAGGGSLDGVLASNGRTIVAVAAPEADAAARVAWRDALTGELLGEFDIEPDLHVTAVSSSGELAVLADAHPGGVAATTHIVAVDRLAGIIGDWSLPGNLVPEAFADAFLGDGAGLPIGIFVIEYIRPEVYRVRVLDTASGELSLPLSLRNKAQTVDETMEAVGRTAVFDPVNRLLFTLYQGVPDGNLPTTAFVHTLGLVNGVYCLDLPVELDLGDLPGAIAADPWGRQLFVASPNGGLAAFAIADILDPDTVPAAEPVAWYEPGESVVVLATVDDVYLAVNGAAGLPPGATSLILRLDPLTLAERGRFASDVAVEAMAITADGTLVVAGGGRLREVGTAGAVLQDRDLPDEVATVARVSVDPAR